MVADILGNVVPMVSMWSMTTAVILQYPQGICVKIPTETKNQRMLKSMDQLYPSLYPCILHPWIQVAVCTQLCHKAAINNKKQVGVTMFQLNFRCSN